MVKRKAEKKRSAAKRDSSLSKSRGAVRKGVSMPVPLLAIKILAVFLGVLLVVALTLYVLGRIPARGFWSLAILLAVLAFGVLPWMRRKFSGDMV